MGDCGAEGRWPGLVSNVRRRARSARPTSSRSLRPFVSCPRASSSASPSGCRIGRRTSSARFTTIRTVPGGRLSAWGARTPRRPWPLVCCSRICAVRRPGIDPNSELYSAAQSRDQAAIIFSLAAKMVRLNPMLARAVRIQETAKTLACPELGTRYRALSAEATTAFGLSPSLIIHDELGRVRGPRSPLYEALETAVGAQEAPLSIVISTQAATDGDLLSILVDDALKGLDPTTVVKLYAAPRDLDPFSEEAIRAANPALDTFMNKREVMAMAADARRMPARENEYRNLVLNQEGRDFDAVPRRRRMDGVRRRAARYHRPKRVRRPGSDRKRRFDRARAGPPRSRMTASGMCGQSSGCLRSVWRRRRPATASLMTCGQGKAISKRRPARRSIMSTSPSA